MSFISAGRQKQTQRAPLLERFLLGESDGALPPSEHLRAAGLAGYSYVTLGSNPARNEFKPDFRGITVRHMTVRAELALLLEAWQAEGVKALLFKGFHLAEFVYPSFGQRPYSDIDLLVKPEHVDAACRAAQELGWEVHWRAGEPDSMHAARAPNYHGHEAAQLRHRELKILVDLHQRIVHNNHNNIRSHRRQKDLTDAVWCCSVETVWEGARLRLPQPVDAVLFGLALNRCWGSDEWQVKPRDYPDFQALVERFGVQREEILERARTLSLQRTLEIYLRRCDPYQRLLDLGRPSWLNLRRWNLKATPERGQRDLERSALAAYSLTGELMEILGVLPTVLRVLRLRSQGRGPHEISERPIGPTRTATMVGFREWKGIRRGIHRCLRLLRCQGAERGLIALLSACAELRRRGVAASVEVKEGTDNGLTLLIDGQRIEGDRFLAGDRQGLGSFED
ncbi:MAG: nucleotidyltransferase family protein [Trueperaceae bacterium]